MKKIAWIYSLTQSLVTARTKNVRINFAKMQLSFKKFKKRYCLYTLFYLHYNPINPICRKTSFHPFHWCPDKTNFGVIIHQNLASKSMQQQQIWLIQTNRINFTKRKCSLNVTSITEIKYKKQTKKTLSITWYIFAYYR